MSIFKTDRNRLKFSYYKIRFVRDTVGFLDIAKDIFMLIFIIFTLDLMERYCPIFWRRYGKVIF
jgi:hypothetical protein